jgi:MerR family transcriptional regulator, light-induced transcriptional regulator
MCGRGRCPGPGAPGDRQACLCPGQPYLTAANPNVSLAWSPGAPNAESMPALAQLGAAWRDGSVSVAGEHFVSAAVARRLAASFDAAGRSVRGPCVVVGLARGCRHELGVLAFAAALRRAGLSVVYVGGDLPPEEWLHTIRVREAVAVVLGVPTPEDVPAVRETVQAVSAAHLKVTVYVGGGYQSEVGGAAQPLGHAIGAASLQLAESLPH